MTTPSKCPLDFRASPDPADPGTLAALEPFNCHVGGIRELQLSLLLEVPATGTSQEGSKSALDNGSESHVAGRGSADRKAGKEGPKH